MSGPRHRCGRNFLDDGGRYSGRRSHSAGVTGRGVKTRQRLSRCRLHIRHMAHVAVRCRSREWDANPAREERRLGGGLNRRALVLRELMREIMQAQQDNPDDKQQAPQKAPPGAAPAPVR